MPLEITEFSVSFSSEVSFMNQPAFQIGDKVAHKYFGIGEIIDIVSETSIKVRFNKGERNIQPNYVKYWDGTKTIEELFENNDCLLYTSPSPRD